jgi:hypothetical protein
MPVPGDTDTHDIIRPSHFLPVYQHLENLLNNLPSEFSPVNESMDSPARPDHAAWLKMAGILTRQALEPGNKAVGRPDGGTLPGHHEKMMANSTEALCSRLRLSKKEKHFVTGIIGNHSRPFHLYKAFKKKALTPKAVTRFFMSVETLAPYLLLLAFAGSRAGLVDRTSFWVFTRHMLHTYYKTYMPGKVCPPFVSGRDLITDFGLPPSPLFKRILARLEEGRLSGEIGNRTAALEMVRKFMP